MISQILFWDFPQNQSFLGSEGKFLKNSFGNKQAPARNSRKIYTNTLLQEDLIAKIYSLSKFSFSQIL